MLEGLLRTAAVVASAIVLLGFDLSFLARYSRARA
jgi:hypothetical protein